MCINEHEKHSEYSFYISVLILYITLWKYQHTLWFMIFFIGKKKHLYYYHAIFTVDIALWNDLAYE
jgi:hypothetical protein